MSNILHNNIYYMSRTGFTYRYILLMKQQFFVNHRYTVLQETDET
jgi:hypothetical protein